MHNFRDAFCGHHHADSLFHQATQRQCASGRKGDREGLSTIFAAHGGEMECLLQPKAMGKGGAPKKAA